MTTTTQTFVDKHRELAVSSILDRFDFQHIIEAERGLYCERCEAPALVRVYRPSSGDNTRANAIGSLLKGDLVAGLRCDICVFLDDSHVVEHLCPCGDVAQAEVEVAWPMYEAIRRRYSAGLWREIPGSYYTYRMCSSCAMAFDVASISPMREVRPGPCRQTELNTIFAQSKVIHDLGVEGFSGLAIALDDPPGSPTSRTVRWVAQVESDVFPHVREPCVQDIEAARDLIARRVTATESELALERRALESSQASRSQLLGGDEYRRLTTAEECELYDVDKTIRRCSEFIEGLSAYLADARTVAAGLTRMAR